MTFKTSFEFEDGPKLRHLQGRKNSGKKHNHPAEVHVQCMKVLSNFLGKQKYISGEQVGNLRFCALFSRKKQQPAT